VIIFFLDSAIVELLAILQFSIKLKLQNITKTHAVTWQQEQADLYLLIPNFYNVLHISGASGPWPCPWKGFSTESFVSSISVIIFGALIGNWIDKTTRLKAAQVFLAVQVPIL
jgi:hypothetical protein